MLNRSLLRFVVATVALVPSAFPQTETEPPLTELPVSDQTRAEQSEQESSGETVVTARKRPEVLADVPGSISVISGEELEESGTESIFEAAARIPNLQITEFSSRRLSFPYLRGIGSGQGDPAVVTYVDGVPQLTTGSTNLPLIALDRIEFLRGPQGTLYGRNALGGVLHLISERPGQDPRFSTGFDFGKFGFEQYRLGYSGPVSEDGMGLTVDALYSKRDGYTDNTFTGNDVDDRDSFFGRAQLYVQPDDRSELRIGVYGERARDGGFILGDLNGLRANPHTINQDFEGVAERDIIAPSIAYETNGDSVDFVSITAFQDWDILETADFDFSPIDGVRRRTTESQEYVYQELRASSAEGAGFEVGDDSELSWLVGVSGFLADSDRAAANDFRPGGAGVLFPPTNVGLDTSSGSFDDTAYGIFGQLMLEKGERLELTAGLRYDNESKDADLRRTFAVGGTTFSDVSQSVDEDYDELVPRFSAAYDIAEETKVYALAAKGFKAGGFNLAAPTGEIAFEPETSWTYEVGFKHEAYEGAVRFAAAIFFIDWEDMQLSLFDPTVGGFVDNAGESTSRGAELEVAATVTDTLDVFGSLGFTDTEFDTFVDPFGADVAGNSLAFAPEETWALGGQYTRQTESGYDWYLRGEYAGVGTFFYDAGNLESENYELVNFRLGIRSGDWHTDLWVKNAFDTEYVPIAFQPNPGDPTQFVGENGAPRTFGISLRLSF